tara:strand:+ start:5605 stop:5787 length:183 start_codon:yes stop_codon:yes gene_type:complete
MQNHVKKEKDMTKVYFNIMKTLGHIEAHLKSIEEKVDRVSSLIGEEVKEDKADGRQPEII